jgi:hypothetical protein
VPPSASWSCARSAAAIRRRAQARGALDLVDRTLRDFGREALRVFDDVR